jgi:hypothetical protein
VRNCLGEWIPSNVLLGLAGALPSSAELIALALGGTAWVTIPGELETRLGLDVKEAMRPRFPHVFIAGLANDYLGYFLTPASYRHPSYVAREPLRRARGVVRDVALAAFADWPRSRARDERDRWAAARLARAGGHPAARLRRGY